MQFQYLSAFRQRLREVTGAYARGRGRKAPARTLAALSPPSTPDGLIRRREQALLATILNHWPLLDEFAELVGTLGFSDPALDKLRQEILLLYATLPDLDTEAAVRHLMETGCSEGIQAIFSPEVLKFAQYARVGSDVGIARTALFELTQGMRLEEAKRKYEAQPTEENLARLRECEGTKYRSLRESV